MIFLITFLMLFDSFFNEFTKIEIFPLSIEFSDELKSFSSRELDKYETYIPQLSKIIYNDSSYYYEDVKPIIKYNVNDLTICAISIETGAGGRDNRIYLNLYDDQKYIDSLLIFATVGCDLYYLRINNIIYEDSILVFEKRYDCDFDKTRKLLLNQKIVYIIENNKYKMINVVDL